VIQERVREGASSGDVYLLVDPALRPIAGNIATWPEQGTPPSAGSISRCRDARHGVRVAHRARRRVHAAGDYRLLVGTDIVDREAFKSRIGLTLLVSLLM